MSVVDFEAERKAKAADAPKEMESKPSLPPFAELAVTTNFSFLRSGSMPEELVARAKELGFSGIGIADRNSVAGVVRAHAPACELKFKMIPGARLCFSDDTPDILAYPRNRTAWGRLTQLLSVGKSRAEKGDCILYFADLLEWSDGFNLIVMPPRALKVEALTPLLIQLRQVTRDHTWLAAAMLYRGDDRRRLARLKAIATDAAVPLLATNDVLYHAAERRALQDVVTCIREHVTLETAGRRLEANAERHFKSVDEMARLFRSIPEAIAETTRFLDQCTFSLEQLRGTEYPEETRQGFTTPQDALVTFVQQGVKKRYPDGADEKVTKALAHELAVTAELGYAPYFLTVHDIVQFARSKGILCQGRGSAANSVICFCLEITEVDPMKVDLLFERFVSAERKEPPDIDVDFEHERREEVIQYIYQRYGRERAGLTATVICYRGRSAIREVGKAFGLSEDTVSALASTLWGWSMEGVQEEEARRVGLDPSDPRLKQVMELTQELMGFPRHLSQHVGGFLITRSRLGDVVPIENAAMEDRTVIEWNKDDLEALGLLKVDVLGLGMLSCLRRSFDLMRQHYNLKPRLPDFRPADEAEVYAMMCRADTIGVFQIESRAQMSMLPRLRPREFYDLVIEVAIVRPGPIQGNMVHPYLQRRERFRDHGIEPEFPSPKPEFGDKDELRSVLRKTMGVPLFQEQAMRLAVVAAKFEPQEASRLRRAMATFKRVGTIQHFRDKFINGMADRGYDRKFAEQCFSQIEGFGEYGFPESHAASFALLVYASAWIKCRYPDVFAAALLNSQPMGFYAPAQIVRCAQEHGVEVREADVNHSDWDCGLESGPKASEHLHPRHASMKGDVKAEHALRLGLRQISGLSEEDGRRIEQVRGKGFDSVRDLWLRTKLPPATLERLARADAFRSLGHDRRTALWAVRALQRSGDKDDLPLFARVAMPEREPDVALPPMRIGEHVIEDYRHLRLSLKAHPVSFLRPDLEQRGILRHERLSTLPSGRIVTVAGLVLVRQRPGSATGVIFMTLEDETGIANTIVWPAKYEEYRPVVLGARLVSITGKLQNESNVVHVVADRIDDLTPLLRRLSDDTTCVEPRSRADEVKRPQGDIRLGHPRNGDALVRLLRQDPALADQLLDAHGVMPKGRNFH
jgi:error-prone DNA polymerase